MNKLLLLFLFFGSLSRVDDGKNLFEEPDDVSVKTATNTLYGSDYREKYRNLYFFNDKNDDVVYTVNYLTDIFGVRNQVTNPDYGIVINGSRVPYAIYSNVFGNEPTWFEWNVNKLIWMGTTVGQRFHDMAKNQIRNFPQGPDGYMWSWGDKAYWQVNLQGGVNNYETAAVSYHYDGSFRYISAVYRIVAWENSTEFLDAVDNHSKRDDSPIDGYIDDSTGKTVWQKTVKCFEFIMEKLNGRNGIIKLPSETDAPVNTPVAAVRLYNSTGALGSNSANYWDNFCYGGYDAYENALFYNCLLAMAGLYDLKGEPAMSKELRDLADTVKVNYDRYFWSETTRRYINAVNTLNGGKHDYGLTFQNTEALVYGLGDEGKAESIFSWLDGTRTVSGDKSQGADIYYYVLAPRTNTVELEKIVDGRGEGRKTWWHGPTSINVLDNGNASWNKHQTNGGMIFFTEYYDLMARLKYKGAADAYNRLSKIADFYAETKFNEQNTRVKNSWQIGFLYEFPEGGLVPIAYLHGFLGINATHRGLEISPHLPPAYDYAGVNMLRYGSNTYRVTVYKDGKLEIETISDPDCQSIINFPSLIYSDGTAQTKFAYEVVDTNGILCANGEVIKNEAGELHFSIPSDIGIGSGKLLIRPQS